MHSICGNKLHRDSDSSKVRDTHTIQRDNRRDVRNNLRNANGAEAAGTDARRHAAPHERKNDGNHGAWRTCVPQQGQSDRGSASSAPDYL